MADAALPDESAQFLTLNGDVPPDPSRDSLLQGIRWRACMYIGSKDEYGLFELLKAVLAESQREYRQGTATTLNLTLHADGSVTCGDDGIGWHGDVFDPAEGLEAAMSQLSPYGQSLSRRGKIVEDSLILGWAVVNALSDRLIATSTSHGARCVYRSSRGVPLAPLAKSHVDADDGFSLRFHPDPEIFGETRFCGSSLLAFLREQAALSPGLRIVFCEEHENRKTVIREPTGVAVLVRDTCQSAEVLWPEPLRTEFRMGEYRLDVALNFTRNQESLCCSFANGSVTTGWGTHVAAVRKGIRLALRSVFRDLPAETLQTLRNGGVIAVAVDIPQPNYEGPTRNKLSNPELETWMTHVTKLCFLELFVQHRAELRAWMQ